MRVGCVLWAGRGKIDLRGGVHRVCVVSILVLPSAGIGNALHAIRAGIHGVSAVVAIAEAEVQQTMV